MREALRWLLISTTLCVSLTGCATTRPVYLHPVLHEDFFSVPAGTQIGKDMTRQDGFFLSKEYMTRVLNVLKIELNQ